MKTPMITIQVLALEGRACLQISWESVCRKESKTEALNIVGYSAALGKYAYFRRQQGVLRTALEPAFRLV